MGLELVAKRYGRGIEFSETYANDLGQRVVYSKIEVIRWRCDGTEKWVRLTGFSPSIDKDYFVQIGNGPRSQLGWNALDPSTVATLSTLPDYVLNALGLGKITTLKDE